MPGFIENDIDQAFPRRFVHLAEDVGRDADKIGVQLGAIPLVIYRGKLVIGQAEPLLHQVIGFGDQPHQAVFDAVMDHFDIVAGRPWSQISDTRLSLDLCGDRFKDWSDALVGFGRTAGHDAGSVAGAVLAAGDADAQILKTSLSQVLGPPVRVSEMRVAAVDEHVAGLQMGQEIAEHRIYRRTGRHQEHHRPRPAQQPRQIPPG